MALFASYLIKELLFMSTDVRLVFGIYLYVLWTLSKFINIFVLYSLILYFIIIYLRSYVIYYKIVA